MCARPDLAVPEALGPLHSRGNPSSASLPSSSTEDLGRELASAIGPGDPRRIDLVCQVGEVIVRTLYGSIERWRSRSRDDRAYARLRSCRGLPMSTAELYRSVRIYEICQRLPELAQSKLSLSHVLVVLSLPPDQQQTFLRRAEREHWTVRRLRKAVSSAGDPSPATGRPRTAPIMKTLEQALSAESAFDGTESLLGLGAKEAKALLEICTRAQEGLHRAEEQLRQVVSRPARPRVVVIDSARTFALRAQNQLRQQGCHVRIAASASSARSIVDETTDCIVVDPSLVDGSGISLARELRRTFPLLGCVFVVDRSAMPTTDAAEIECVAKESGLTALRVAVTRAAQPRVDARMGRYLRPLVHAPKVRGNESPRNPME